MTNIITQKTSHREEWLRQLANVVSDPKELLALLQLENASELTAGLSAQRLFPLRVPRTFIQKIEKNNPNDPLLLQILTQEAEFITHADFSVDPLKEQNSAIPNLLHKYHNRALMLVKTACAINCRYCFRRHFPYQDNAGNKRNWQQALTYIQQHPQLNEIIFSGGDPMMAKDHELDWLITQLEAIPHIKRLRIHSRLISVLPARITHGLCQRLSQSRLTILFVTHINHANEIDDEVKASMRRLKQHGVTLLNQSVLLKGINDRAQTLAELSDALFDSGILPYYLHVLDKVQGASHFLVNDQDAREIIKQLMTQVSGYLVPKLAREIGGEKSKTLLDLQLIPETSCSS